jgi:hypothetical protein
VHFRNKSSSGKSTHPSRNVGELGVMIPNPDEQLAGPRFGTGPLVKVGQRVGPPEVVVAGPRRDPPTLFQEGEALLYTALVGKCSGGHQSALGDERAAGGGITEFSPQHLDVVPPALSAMAVGQHRVLLRTSGHLTEDLEALGRRLPVAHAVVHEPEQLDYLRHLWCSFHQLIQDATGILEPIVGEGAGGFVQSIEGLAARPVA